MIRLMMNRVEKVGDDRVDHESDGHWKRALDTQHDRARIDGAVKDEKQRGGPSKATDVLASNFSFFGRSHFLILFLGFT